MIVNGFLPKINLHHLETLNFAVFTFHLCISLQLWVANSEHKDVTKGYNMCLQNPPPPQPRDAKGTTFQPLRTFKQKNTWHESVLERSLPWIISKYIVVLQVVIPTLQVLVPASTYSATEEHAWRLGAGFGKNGSLSRHRNSWWHKPNCHVSHHLIDVNVRPIMP